MASIILVDRTTTSLTCRVSGQFPSSWATGVNWYLDLEYVTSLSASSDADTQWTFGGLSPGTTHEVKFVAWDDAGNRFEDPVIANFTTLAETPSGSRPDYWAWESSIGAGGALNVTAAEWNRFIDRIYAFAAYKGISMPGAASDYYAVKGEDMLAVEVNAVRSLLANLLPPSPPPGQVTRGQEITAAWFDNMKNSLNSIS